MHNSQHTAERIKDAAKIKGVSVRLLLQSVGVNKNLIYTMQTKEYFPRVEALAKIADYLDVSVDFLLGRTENPEVNK